ncbi:MAG: nitronate monooxygenase, partial [Deltaproteobacteria bacterium]|nr:nitronate monooxygenase [Deltaproteobacteria bacterium]
NSDKPVIVKLSPNVTDITAVARAVEKAGAHALSLINTLTGMAIDIYTREPKLASFSGGLSGPAIRPVALYMVHEVVSAVRIPVIGIGGIVDYRDALEFLIAGARAIQVGTANFVNPRATLDIVEGLKKFCEDQGISSIDEIMLYFRVSEKHRRQLCPGASDAILPGHGPTRYRDDIKVSFLPLWGTPSDRIC